MATYRDRFLDMPKRIEVVGREFGRLTVLSDAEKSRSGRRRVLCLCVCGETTISDPRLLLSGKTKSCGCLHREVISGVVKARKKFDIPANDMPENNIWQGMKQRCFNPNQKHFASYGGRGITVCERWVASFEAFLLDMGRRPSSGHSIDRIDVNGNYEPENCRWATSKQQGLNRRYHRMVDFKGESMPLAEACRLSGVKYHSARYRLDRGRDWSAAA